MNNKYARLLVLHILRPKYRLYFTPATLALLQVTQLYDEASGTVQATSRKADTQRTPYPHTGTHTHEYIHTDTHSQKNAYRVE